MTVLLDGSFPAWGGWTPQTPVPGRTSFVTDMPRRDLVTARFELRPGDTYTDGKARNEVYRLDYLHEGDERYVGWSMFLPSDFPASTAAQWHLFAQLKQRGTGSPPLSFELSGSGDQMRVKRNDLGPGNPAFTVIAWPGSGFRGKWMDVVLHVKFSTDPAVGFVEVWLNGTQRSLSGGVLRKYAATLDPNGEPSYPKLGYYRDLSCSTTGVVFHNGYRIGETYEDVAA